MYFSGSVLDGAHSVVDAVIDVGGSPYYCPISIDLKVGGSSLAVSLCGLFWAGAIYCFVSRSLDPF